MSKISALLELAFHSGAAVDANQLIDDVRRRVTQELGRAANYEVSLIGRQWDYLERLVAPRLAFYLASKSYSVAHCDPVFLTLFVDKTVFFVRASAFYEYLRQVKGLDQETYGRLTATWEKTGQAALAALPETGSDR